MMKVNIKWPATIGKLAIPAGEYDVRIGSDGGQVSLIRGDATYKVSAVKRPGKTTVRFMEAVFRPTQGDPIWSLLIFTPPKNEWVIFVNMPKPRGAVFKEKD